MSYYELLKHPNWQRKRLEILNRSLFSCETCGAEDQTLQVHHTYYEKGLKPWEYPDESLRSLCEDCHVKAQETMKELHRAIGKVSNGDMGSVLGYAMAMASLDDHRPLFEVPSYEVACGVADAWGCEPEDVINSLVDGKSSGEIGERMRSRLREALCRTGSSGK